MKNGGQNIVIDSTQNKSPGMGQLSRSNSNMEQMVTSSQPDNDSLSLDEGVSHVIKDQSICDSMNTSSMKKKDKKLVFLSRSVL